MQFIDRHEAGRRLAERLLPLKDKRPVVLALPRGAIRYRSGWQNS